MRDWDWARAAVSSERERRDVPRDAGVRSIMDEGGDEEVFVVVVVKGGRVRDKVAIVSSAVVPSRVREDSIACRIASRASCATVDEEDSVVGVMEFS